MFSLLYKSPSVCFRLQSTELHQEPDLLRLDYDGGTRSGAHLSRVGFVEQQAVRQGQPCRQGQLHWQDTDRQHLLDPVGSGSSSRSTAGTDADRPWSVPGGRQFRDRSLEKLADTFDHSRFCRDIKRPKWDSVSSTVLFHRLCTHRS